MADRDAATTAAAFPQAGVADGGPKIGVFLAIADFPLLVAGYRAVIDATPDLRVVGAIESRETAQQQVAGTAADIVVTEWLPSTATRRPAFPSIEEVRVARPTARILAIECRCGSEQFSLAMRAGAHGFLERRATPGEVVSALRCIGHGETYVSPAMVTQMVNAHVRRSAPRAPGDAFEALSEPAREVFRLAAVGHTNREIARTLQLSEQAVHNHRATVMAKLGVHDRVELLRYALRRGLVQGTEL
jgi:DNA-binding NarL/FixJ family response regulator